MICAPTIKCGRQGISVGAAHWAARHRFLLWHCVKGQEKTQPPGWAAVLQNLEDYFRLKKAFMPVLGHVAQPPIVCQRTQWGPDYLKCSGEVNSPCAKVFACGKNACTRLPALPLRRHKVRSAPFLPAAKTSLRSLAPPPPRRPTALGSSGAPQDGAPRSWATGKSKAARRAALLQNSETYFRLKKAFIPGY